MVFVVNCTCRLLLLLLLDEVSYTHTCNRHICNRFIPFLHEIRFYKIRIANCWRRSEKNKRNVKNEQKKEKRIDFYCWIYFRPSKSAHMHTTHMVSVTANCHSSSKTQNPTFENLNVYTISWTATKITNVFYGQDGDDEHEMKIDFFFLFFRSFHCFALLAVLLSYFCRLQNKERNV